MFKRALIGAYFTKEYAIESAALFNPSIVPHPDQSHLKKGSLRFIMSLRATVKAMFRQLYFAAASLTGTIRFFSTRSVILWKRRISN
jgi:hypothetical protein